MEYEFRRNPDPGAILALTSPADKEETSDIRGMEEYIHKHAEAIYKHAINAGERRESLYIVTGCIKSASCAMAAYKEGMAGADDTLRLRPTRETRPGGPPVYVWTKYPSSSRARVGTSSQPGVKDQSLFLLGFKLAFSPRFRSGVDAESSHGSGSSNPPGSGSRGVEDFDDQSGTCNRGPPHGNGRESGPGYGGGNAAGPDAGPSCHYRCTLSCEPSPSNLDKYEAVHLSKSLLDSPRLRLC